MTPSTGTATRPAGREGSGRSSRGSASSTARAPAAAAAAARAPGSLPARTTASRSRTRRPSASGSSSSTGPAVRNPAARGGAPASRSAPGAPASPTVRSTRATASGAASAAAASAAGAEAGEPTTPPVPAAAPSPPAGATTSVPSSSALRIASASGVSSKPANGALTPTSATAHVVVRRAVAVRVHRVLEPGQELVGDGDVLRPRAAAGGLRAGHADRQHPLARRHEHPRQRGPARLAPAARRPRRVVVVGDRVVPGVQRAVEQRVLRVDARVEHGDRRPAQRRRGRRRPQPGHPGGLGGRRVEAADRVRADAQRGQLGEVGGPDRGREAVEDARVGAHVGEPHAASRERRAQRGGLVAQRLLVGPLRHGIADAGRAQRGPRQAHDHPGARGAGLPRRAAVVRSAVPPARRRLPSTAGGQRPDDDGRRDEREREPEGGRAAPGGGARAGRPPAGSARRARALLRPRAGAGGRRWRRRPAPGSRETGARRPTARRSRSSRRCPCTARAAAR